MLSILFMLLTLSLMFKFCLGMFDMMLLLVEVEFEWVVVGVQTHFHVKPNSVELS